MTSLFSRKKKSPGRSRKAKAAKPVEPVGPFTVWDYTANAPAAERPTLAEANALAVNLNEAWRRLAPPRGHTTLGCRYLAGRIIEGSFRPELRQDEPVTLASFEAHGLGKKYGHGEAGLSRRGVGGISNTLVQGSLSLVGGAFQWIAPVNQAPVFAGAAGEAEVWTSTPEIEARATFRPLTGRALYVLTVSGGRGCPVQSHRFDVIPQAAAR